MESSVKATYSCLVQKYSRVTINKKEMAKELGVSLSTLDLYMSRGIGVPKYKKLGNKPNSKVIFNLYELAVFLHSNQIETL